MAKYFFQRRGWRDVDISGQHIIMDKNIYLIYLSCINNFTTFSFGIWWRSYNLIGIVSLLKRCTQNCDVFHKKNEWVTWKFMITVFILNESQDIALEIRTSSAAFHFFHFILAHITKHLVMTLHNYSLEDGELWIGRG